MSGLIEQTIFDTTDELDPERTQVRARLVGDRFPRHRRSRNHSSMRRAMLRALLLLAILLLPVASFAGGPCSGVKGGCGRGSSYRSAPASGPVHVSGYVNKKGTYVQPHYRSRPDGDFSNNWSTVGNVNPFTGEAGTKRGPSYRTKSRTEARTVAWGGTGSTRDDEDDRRIRYAPPPVERTEHEMRTWHGGKHSVEARFVSLLHDKVKLHTSDGRDISVDLDVLSDVDRKWIDRRR